MNPTLANLLTLDALIQQTEDSQERATYQDLQRKLQSYLSLRAEVVDSISQIYERYHLSVGKDAYTESELNTINLLKNLLNNASESGIESSGTALVERSEEVAVYAA